MIKKNGICFARYLYPLNFRKLQALQKPRDSRFLGNRESPTVDRILERSTACQVTDLRDKVYALLGILGYPSIKVDYRMTVEDVYTSFSQAVFEDARNIKLLHQFGIGRKIDTLPSWVIDLSVSSHVGRFQLNRNWKNEISKLIDQVMDGFRIDGSSMFIKGRQIDQVQEVGEALQPSNSPASRGHAAQTVFRNWELCAGRIKNPISGAPIPAAFWTTLGAHDHTLNGKYSPPAKYDDGFLQWYASFGSGELKKAYADHWRDAEIVRSWRRWQDKLKYGYIPGYMSGPADDIIIPSRMECCYGRRFFTTTGGSMGLCNARTKAGILIVFLSGGTYPFTLRPRDDNTFSMIGECYLYRFDEYGFTIEEVENFKEFILR
jgi:hypothetical protein